MAVVSKETKIKIIKDQLDNLANTLYTLQVQGKVANAIGDTNNIEAVKKQMEKFVKMEDEYLKELASLEGE